MTKNVNIITLVGKIESEPRYHKPHDKLICDFHFITKVAGRALKEDGNGDKKVIDKSNTQEFNVRLFGPDAEKAQTQGLRKGREVYLEGHLELLVYKENKEHQDKGYINFMARDFSVELWVYTYKFILMD